MDGFEFRVLLGNQLCDETKAKQQEAQDFEQIGGIASSRRSTIVMRPTTTPDAASASPLIPNSTIGLREKNKKNPTESRSSRP